MAPEADADADADAGRSEEDETDSDSDRLARIDAYVREQQKEGSDWLGKLATYLGLAAFFFGIGTFTDLKSHFFDSDKEATNARAAAVQYLDISCRAFLSHKLPPKNASYDALARYDQSVLFDRDAHNYVWGSLDTSDLSDADAEISLALKRSYFAASHFLAAAVSAAQAKNAQEYAVAIGQYNEADSQFLKESADFGLSPGACSWAAADAPTVADLDRARPR
jgi:hypothetical protein